MSWRPFNSRYLAALLLLTMYVATGYLCIELGSIQSANLVVIWLPSGIALLSILILGRLGAGVVFIAHLLLNFPYNYAYSQDTLFISLITLLAAGIDTLQALVSAHFYRQIRQKYGDSLWLTPEALPIIWLKVCTIPVLLSAPLLATIWHFSGLLNSNTSVEWLQLIGILGLGDIAGILLLLPFYYDWENKLIHTSLKGIWPAMLGLCIILTAAIFIDRHLLVLSLPVMLMIAVKHRLPGVNQAILAISLISILGTHFGYGGFLAESTIQTFLNLQIFIFSIALTFQYYALTQNAVMNHKAHLEAEVNARTQALINANELLSELATTDELTQVPNRREWQRRCAEAIVRTRRYKQPLSIILLDIDHFKKVNDQHGHLIGDLVLKRISQLCVQHLRAIDTFARWGGEEFVILLPETDLAQASNVAEKLRQVIAEQAVVMDGNSPVYATISLGVTALSIIDLTLDDLLSRTDEALYAAKANGRNCVINTSSMSTSYLRPGINHSSQR
ncbi:sensor domain-containing diguanylate cyclase [Chitinibacter bivalviorum]|uniref:diguanylate cyclase n=1 Tax=Chitinibacter bivalviorum TaxID=2739434 RepID=A0A7H9BEK7_9NEIS|nr:diguanylate cyclase [Chitinibacter bivalviorum]QLG87059.1 sensor domain-containing diguanylate cyclase [Chitinibacter bivalviorum]